MAGETNKAFTLFLKHFYSQLCKYSTARLKGGIHFPRSNTESPSIQAESAQDGVECLARSKLPILSVNKQRVRKWLQKPSVHSEHQASSLNHQCPGGVRSGGVAHGDGPIKVEVVHPADQGDKKGTKQVGRWRVYARSLPHQPLWCSCFSFLHHRTSLFLHLVGCLFCITSGIKRLQ